METRPALILRRPIRYANYRLYEKSEEREEYHGMGTTLVVLTVYKDEALAANIGDSRLYEISQKQIRQISEDHSLVAELVRKGELSATEARRHPDKNIITRALESRTRRRLICFRFVWRQETAICSVLMD